MKLSLLFVDFNTKIESLFGVTFKMQFSKHRCLRRLTNLVPNCDPLVDDTRCNAKQQLLMCCTWDHGRYTDAFNTTYLFIKQSIIWKANVCGRHSPVTDKGSVFVRHITGELICLAL